MFRSVRPGPESEQKMEKARQARLILFTRYPEPGRAKTRLIPALGAEGAAALQRRMSETIVARMVRFAGKYPVGLEIRYTDGNQQAMAAWLSSDEIELNDLLWNSSVLVGADTPLGPLYLSYGFTEKTRGVFYIYLGRKF